MALARVQYESDGSTTVYSIPFPYINRDDIKVSIDGVETQDFVFLDGSTVDLDTAPALGDIIDVVRETERNDLLVEFNDGSTLLESDLTLAAQQSFFIAQEAFDQTGATLTVADDGSYSASDRRISLLKYPNSSDDAANKQYVDDIFAQGEDAFEQAQIATNAADDSISARDAAQAAEATTLNYRDTAEQHKIDAAASASAASTSETNAADSATAAQASEDDVAANAQAAQDAEDLALAHRDDAAASASAASTSETNANDSAVSADNDAAAASNSASNAATSETNAQTYRDQAQSSASAASTSESNAATSEQNAADSEAAADSHQTEAQNWASTAEDTLVPEGDGVDDYSALHWARKAEGFAGGVNLPSATGNALKMLRQKADETGFEYIPDYHEFGLGSINDGDSFANQGENTPAGFYAGTTLTASGDDAPYDGDWVWIHMTRGNRPVQLAFNYLDYTAHYRAMGADGWRPWKKLVDDGLETDWIAPSFLNGWENYGSSFRTVQYKRDANGFVHLKGLIRNGTPGTHMFLLPSGFRPDRTIIASAINGSATNETERVDIQAAGYVSQNVSDSVSWISLDGIPPFYPDGD